MRDARDAFDRGDHPAAAELFDLVVQRVDAGPAKVEALLGLADIAWNADSYDDAFTLIRFAESADPTSSTSRGWCDELRGDILADLGRHNEAAQAFRRAGATLKFARALWRSDEPELALDVASGWIRQKRESNPRVAASTSAEFGSRLYEAGQPTNALPWFDLAVEIYRSIPDWHWLAVTLDSRAEVYRHMGNGARARADESEAERARGRGQSE